MFYCEIDENGFCFHVTENVLPLGDRIILSDENRLGMVLENGEWKEYIPEETNEGILLEQGVTAE